MSTNDCKDVKEILVIDLIKYKERLERRIKKNKAKIEDLKAREEHLSKHGYWDLGYFKGKENVLEELLDNVNDLLKG